MALGLVSQEPGIHHGACRGPRLLLDVRDALERERERHEVGAGLDLGERLEPPPRVHHVVEPGREHCLDEVGVQLVAPLRTEPAPDEVEHLLGDDGSVRGELHPRERVQRLLDRGGEREVVPAGEEDAKDADRRTPQAERIGCPRRLLAHADDADERVEPVRERDERAHVAAGHLARGAHRLVMILDRVRDLRLQPLEPGVVAAHHALELRELAHHAGREVRLREPRRLDHVGHEVFAPDRPRERAPDRHDAVRARELAPEPSLERPPPEVLDAIPERPALVLLEEEPRVGEPRAQHALVAVTGDVRILHRRAGDRDEPVLEPALPVDHREVALVVPHLGDDHLGRQVEVRLLELAGHAGRVLDEVEHLLDERLVRPDLPARRLRRLRELLLEDRSPLGRIREHPRPAELRDVVLGRSLQRDRLRRGEAVAERHLARYDLAVADLERPATVERDHPADGAREGHLVVARAHRLAESQAREEPLEQLGQHLLGLPPLLEPRHREALALRRLGALEPRDVHALALREPERGLGRVPGGVERVRDRRSERLRLRVGLAFRDVPCPHREPPRRTDRLHLAVGEPRGVERLREVPLELLQRRGDEARRDLLRANLEQKVRHVVSLAEEEEAPTAPAQPAAAHPEPVEGPAPPPPPASAPPAATAGTRAPRASRGSPSRTRGRARGRDRCTPPAP